MAFAMPPFVVLSTCFRAPTTWLLPSWWIQATTAWPAYCQHRVEDNRYLSLCKLTPSPPVTTIFCGTAGLTATVVSTLYCCFAAFIILKKLFPRPRSSFWKNFQGDKNYVVTINPSSRHLSQGACNLGSRHITWTVGLLLTSNRNPFFRNRHCLESRATTSSCCPIIAPSSD